MYSHSPALTPAPVTSTKWLQPIRREWPLYPWEVSSPSYQIMKKAIFVNPSWDRYVSRRGTRYNRHWPPLDLLNCAAILEEHGFRCVVYNQRIEDQCEVQVEDEDIVFVTSSTLDRWQCLNLGPGTICASHHALSGGSHICSWSTWDHGSGLCS